MLGWSSSGAGRDRPALTCRDNEGEAYMKLQSLCGALIPPIVSSADFDFCFGIVLEV